MNTFFQHRDVHKYTRCRDSLGQQSLTDFCIVSANWCRSLMDVRVKRDAEVSTDHYLLVCNFLEKPLGPTQTCRTRISYRINCEALADKHVKRPSRATYSPCSEHVRNLVGGTGDVSPSHFRRGDIICHAPHFFLFRFFIWRRFKNKNVYHVLCEELFMLDGRPHIAELILNRVWYHWFRWFMNFSFDKLIFTIFQVSRERERCLTAFVRHSTLWYTVRKVIFL